MLIHPEQYDLLVRLMRGNTESPSNQAARLILVSGMAAHEAQSATGASSLHTLRAMRRYANAHALLDGLYRKPQPGITGEQFDALVKLMRGSPQSSGTTAARRVLVDGIRQAEAMRETGASRSTVFLCAERYREAHEQVAAAYSV